MKKEKQNIWSEVKADHTDEETGITSVDAFLTEDENEGGNVIATIDDFGNVTYLDERAKTDEYAQEIIQEKIREIEDDRHELVDKVIERLKTDFLEEDYTVIDELLVFNVSMKALRNSLPEEGI
jgi:hypothetical protein